jgi:tetratricopeptide (TPR) repeat protein
VRAALAVLLAAVLLGAGCADAPQARQEAARRAALERHQALALAHEERGELRQALEAWRVADALAPGSAQVEERLRALGARIDARVREHLRAAGAARRQGQPRVARIHLLQALALRPADRTAREALRSVTHAQALARLAQAPRAKPAAPAAAPAIEEGPAYPPEYGLDKAQPAEDEGLEAGASDGGEAKAGQPGPPASGTTTRAAQAQRAYVRGVRAFRVDLDTAIAAFEQALALDPDHARARSYLAIARRLRRQRAGD